MKVRIHRGTAEIGGNCIEVESQGKSILLDLGMPLMGKMSPAEALPPVPGLLDGSNPNLLTIVISHPHADHYGLVGYAHRSIPIHIGREAEQLLQAAAPFSPWGLDLSNASTYRHRVTFTIGPFAITPYLVDHSAFDAYCLLVEADGKRLFYSGDVRGHGWKSRSFDNLVANGPKNVTAMLLEGTTLGRRDAARAETEANLVDRLKDVMASTQGIVLAAFSGQNIDRFVTFYKAAKAAKRSFVADLYLAHLLKKLARKSLPDPAGGGMRVFLPRSIKRRIVRERRFDLVEPFRARRIYQPELHRRARSVVMSFRSSMTRDLEEADCLAGGTVIYSMWPGYLDRSQPDLRDWAAHQGMRFEIIHTSGHADAYDLSRLVRSIAPGCLIPIHTLAPDRYVEFGAPVVKAQDGAWLPIG